MRDLPIGTLVTKRGAPPDAPPGIVITPRSGWGLYGFLSSRGWFRSAHEDNIEARGRRELTEHERKQSAEYSRSWQTVAWPETDRERRQKRQKG